MMKILTIILTLACAFIPTVTDATAPNGGATASAAEVLRLGAQAIRKAPSLEAAFTVTTDRGSTSGNILLSGSRFMISTPDLTTWFDGKTQWAYSPAANEVNISEPTDAELQQINPFAIIAGMQTAYTPRRLKSPVGSDRIELIPKNQSEYRKIIVTFNGTTHYPSDIAITSDDNSITRIIISNIHTGKKPSDTAFRFNPKRYPEAEIVDLR